jgi:hypothetical protein
MRSGKTTTMKWMVALGACLALAHSIGALAQTATTPQTATQNQAAGLAFGASMNSSTTLSPSASAILATTPGANNVWGTAYTGTAEPALTGSATSSSMIGIGTTSVNKSVAGFTGYNNNRDQQADQAAVFLKTKPLSVPTFLANDPLRTIPVTSTATDPFASSSSTTCHQTTLTSPLDSASTYVCQETNNPYTHTCTKDQAASVVQVAMVTAGVLMSSISSDIAISNTVQGDGSYQVVFGPPGNDYWGNGTYIRNLNFRMSANVIMSRFVIQHASFDDWLRIKVNGTIVYLGPWDVNGDIGWGELGRSWSFPLDIDLIPHLVEGNNTIEATTVVVGGGESFVTMNMLAYACPDGSQMIGQACFVVNTASTDNCVAANLLTQ